MDSQQQETTHQTRRTKRKHSNLCIECGIDMGDCNPRQLCGKWRCLFAGDDDENVVDG